MEQSKSRNFCFTINNWNEQDIVTLERNLNYKYLIFGKEVGEKGTPHLQGYVNLKNPRSWKGMKKEHPTWHLEECIGTPKENFEYCSKDKDFIEFGERPKGKGNRSDIDTIKEMVMNGENDLRKIYQEASSWQSYRMGEKGVELFEKRRNWKTKVLWFYGSTGTGKTKTAFEMYPNAWCTGNIVNDFVFDGYRGEEEVILDDLRPNDLKFNELLRLFDRYPYRVRTIGGSRQFVAKVIVVTTTCRPEEFFEFYEDIGQLMRRIEEVRLFGTGTEVRGNTSTLTFGLEEMLNM